MPPARGPAALALLPDGPVDIIAPTNHIGLPLPMAGQRSQHLGITCSKCALLGIPPAGLGVTQSRLRSGFRGGGVIMA